MEVNTDFLFRVIRECGRPMRTTELAQEAVKHWLETQGRQRRYVPGGRYDVGEKVLFEGQEAIVTRFASGQNPKQGTFDIITLQLEDGQEKHMAGGVPGADSRDYINVSSQDVQRLLDERGLLMRKTVEKSLREDSRFVHVPDKLGGHCYLTHLLRDISTDDVKRVVNLLEENHAHEELPAPVATEILVDYLWNLENDGSDYYRLIAFSLEAQLQRFQEFEHFPGDGWVLTTALQKFQQREELVSPRQPNIVPPPTIGLIQELPESKSDVEIGADPTSDQEEEDFIAWQEKRLSGAEFTLYAKHYYFSWLPLTARMRRVFPPTKSHIVFFHRFGGSEQKFTALLDPEQGRIFGGKTMYDAFRDNTIYPGAKLVVTHRGKLNEYDIRTKPVGTGQTIQVRRLELAHDGTLHDWIETEPMRYEVDKYVLVGEVRWEDVSALFENADKVGKGIFELMYRLCLAWEGERGKPLFVSADELYEAIHFNGQGGRPTAVASINWELWRRSAFQTTGDGKYWFRAEFGDHVRSQIISSIHPKKKINNQANSSSIKDRTLKGSAASLQGAIEFYLKQDLQRRPVLFLRKVAHERIRQLLAADKLSSLTIHDFNTQVWQLGYFRHRGQVGNITTPATYDLLRSLEVNRLDIMYQSGELEIEGNQTWGSATHIYGAQLKCSNQEKEELLRETVNHLLYSGGSTITRLQDILDAPNGLGMNSLTGILHAVHPDQHILYNGQSVRAMELLGNNWPKNWRSRADTYERYRRYTLELRRHFGFESLSDVDWFIYQLATGQITIGEKAGEGNERTLLDAPAYFILQQDPQSEYEDKEGFLYNWKAGIPGSRQMVDGARFVYYQPGKQIFFGTGRISHITSYVSDGGTRHYNGYIEQYDPWYPPLSLSKSLGSTLSFIDPERRLWVGQAGIRKISKRDFETIVRTYKLLKERSGIS